MEYSHPWIVLSCIYTHDCELKFVSECVEEKTIDLILLHHVFFLFVPVLMMIICI